MNRVSLPPKNLHRLASIALLVCLVFQLGACSCGCLEHNAWVELFQLSTDDHGHDLAQSDRASGGVSIEDNHHDCTGEARPQYVNTARDVSSIQNEGRPTHTYPVALASDHLSHSMTPSGFHSPPPPGRLHALSRPVTQIFRL